MKLYQIFTIATLFLLSSCIGDDFVSDFVEPEIRVSALPSSIGSGDNYQVVARFFNNIGFEISVDLNYESDDISIFKVDNTGLITGQNEGEAILTITTIYEDVLYSATKTINISMNTVVEEESRNGTINTTSSYLLEGTFEIKATGSGIRIDIAEDYKASTNLPGLYIYLTNNPASNAGALEIGMVETFSGAHSYEVDGVGLDDHSYILYYCKPFSVKVGDGQIN